MKNHDIIGICNALVDVLIEVTDTELESLGLSRGVMHLVDAARQQEVLDRFASRTHTVELGGSAMNAIRTLAALGRRTVFTGMIAEDEFGTRVRRRMEQLRIRQNLGTSREPTGTCLILITPDHERTMVTHLGASRLYDASHVPHDDIRGSRVLHFCGYQWDTDGQKEAIAAAIRTAKASDTLVSFDVADPFAVNRNQAAFIDVIRSDADIVFSNKEEARMLYGSDAETAAAAIAATGAIAVIKLGAEGALIRRGSDVFRIPPFPTQVLDTTAAGDMFAAGFLNGILGGQDLHTAGRMAARIASDVISRIGATVSDLALAEVASMQKP